MINRKTFFDKVRHQPFPGSLTPDQVSGMEAVLTEWERRGLTDLRWLAYMLATDFHETDQKMQAIREYGRGKGRKYGNIGRHGQVAYGRGLVQLTWDDNYERADRELGLKGALIKNFDLALDLNVAVKIMFDGMIQGWFTGKKLADYLNAKTDYVNARRIINGTDKAEMVAGYARQFAGALTASAEPAGKVPPPPDIPKPAPPKPATGWLAAILNLFKRKG